MQAAPAATQDQSRPEL